MKEKIFQLIKKMESDGWDLIVVDVYTTKTRLHISDSWFAILIKDGIEIYIEFGDEKDIWMRDVKQECPKCGRLVHDNSIHDGWDFCPDCEVAPVYKKEINEEYLKWKS
jgi:hypothetical protein